MNLKSLILLAAISYTLVIGGGLLFYRIYIAYPEIEKITLENHKNDFEIIENTYIHQRISMGYMNLDWAKWDDMYEFVSLKDPTFIKKNIQSSSFNLINMDAIAIYDEHKKPVFIGIKDGHTIKSINDLNDITPDIDIDLLFTRDHDFGMIRVKNKVAYFTSYGIQDSEEKRPISGHLIFIRIFDDAFRNRINKLTGSNVRSVLFPNGQTKPAKNNALRDIKKVRQDYTFELHSHNNRNIGTLYIQYPTNQLPNPLDPVTITSISILLLLPIIITVLVYILFLRPMTFIFNTIGEMKKTGKLADINVHTHITEIDDFTKSFNIFTKQLKNYQSKLEQESNTDGLTEIFNRRYFDQKFDEIWRLCTRNSTNIAIIMIDIDFFKKYNDLYGHQMGDEALRSVATCLKNQTRRATETLARYGGEEFIITIESTNRQKLELFLSRVIVKISQLNIAHKDSEVSDHLTISCGACLIDEPGEWMKNAKELAIKVADDALYEAKKTGRNRFILKAFGSSHKKN